MFGSAVLLALGQARASHAQLKGDYIPGLHGPRELVYYGQFKVTSDQGPLGSDLLFEGKKDHVFGTGLAGSLFFRKARMFVGLRVLPEFGAIDRPQGWTFMLSLAYEAKSLVSMPPSSLSRSLPTRPKKT